MADISSHLDTFTQPEADALVFTSPHGMPCGTPTSAAASGVAHSPQPVSAFTCTTCAIPVTSSSLKQAPTLVS